MHTHTHSLSLFQFYSPLTCHKWVFFALRTGVKIPVFQRVDLESKDASSLVGLARGGQKLEDSRKRERERQREGSLVGLARGGHDVKRISVYIEESCYIYVYREAGMEGGREGGREKERERERESSRVAA